MATVRPTITPEQLTAAGYSTFNDPFQRKDGVTYGYIASHQKRFDDERGKRYFITFAHHRFVTDSHDLESMSADTQFCVEGGAQTFNVELVGSADMTLAQVEAFFERMWLSMRCDYYETWYGDERHVAQTAAQSA